MNNYNFEILSKDEIVDIFGLTIPNNILPNLKIPCLKFFCVFKVQAWKTYKEFIGITPLQTEEDIKNANFNSRMLIDFADHLTTDNRKLLWKKILFEIEKENKELILNFINDDGPNF